MGNRHRNKRLTAAVRAAMVQTGESYQKVLCRLRRAEPRAAGVDLIAVDYFGLPLTLATFEVMGNLSCVVTSAEHLSQPFPKSPLFAVAKPRDLS